MKDICYGAGCVPSDLEYKVLSSSRTLTVTLLDINAVRTEQSVTLNVKGLVIL
jgi:hypothetical protein